MFADDHQDKWQPEPNTGCHIWTGAATGKGRKHQPRPCVKQSGKSVSVARVVCEEAHGPPPSPEHHAAHKRHCNNTMCVNDTHLYWGTRSQNEMDKPAAVRIRSAQISGHHGGIATAKARV